MAQLEAEVSRSRKQEPTFDQEAFRRSMTTDPVGMMQRMGIPVDHVNRVLVAHTLGDQAPDGLKALVHMGPQISATQALQSQVEALSRQLSDLTGAQNKKGKRESFKALSADKAKYPGLAKALEKDAALFDEDIETFGGSAEEFASREEARLKRMGFYAAPPASDENADSESDQSKQIQPAIAANLNGEMPPLTKPKQGAFTAEEHERLKQEAIRISSSSQTA